MANTLPSSIKTEDAIIASCLLFEENVDAAISTLNADDFYDETNQDVWRQIENLHSEGRPIEQHTIEDRLEKDIYYDMTQTSADVGGDAEVVKQYSQLRNIIKTCQRASSQASSKQNPQDVLATLNSLFEETSDSSIVSIGEAIADAVERNMKVADGEVPLGVKTGLDVDDKIGGYEDGRLYIVAARPAHGKSAYALHVMKQIADTGIPVGMMSLEMTSMGLANRLLINAMNIDGMKIRSGNITDQEKDIMMDAAGQVSNLPIYFDDDPIMTAGSLRAKANILRRKYGIGLLVIDYLQLMSGNGNHGTREQEVSEISRTCKLVAKELNIPVIALSQLSRKVENRNIKRPQLADLRESGAIEQDADCVQFLYRPAEYGREQYPSGDIFKGSTTNICEVIVSKNRDGQTGVEQQLFFANKMRFENLNYKYD